MPRRTGPGARRRWVATRRARIAEGAYRAARMADEVTRLVSARITESVELQQKLLEPDRRALIARAAQLMADSLRGGGKVLLFGNGGSAADAQHIAAELVGRYLKERAAL